MPSFELGKDRAQHRLFAELQRPAHYHCIATGEKTEYDWPRFVPALGYRTLVPIRSPERDRAQLIFFIIVHA